MVMLLILVMDKLMDYLRTLSSHYDSCVSVLRTLWYLEPGASHSLTRHIRP
jgi:hypothetical protein